jgi:phosphohistidine phosphatase
MYLYLIQHGEAKSKEEDPARPLSDRGRSDVAKVASHVSSITVDSLYHSGKRRAVETAEIFSEHIKPKEGIYEEEGLASMDDPGIWAGRLKTEEKDTMLVGHLPHMARLASLLLTGDSEAGVVEFRMGGIVCLKKEEGKWSLQWMVVPEIISK